jgi:hypothetical protein
MAGQRCSKKNVVFCVLCLCVHGRHSGYYRHINAGRLGAQKYRSPATGHSSFAIFPIPIRQAGSSLPYVSLEWRKIVDSCYLHAIRAEGCGFLCRTTLVTQGKGGCERSMTGPRRTGRVGVRPSHGNNATLGHCFGRAHEQVAKGKKRPSIDTGSSRLKSLNSYEERFCAGWGTGEGPHTGEYQLVG